MSETQRLHDSMDRLGASALQWRARAERYETALMLIAAQLPDGSHPLDRQLAPEMVAICGIANAALAQAVAPERATLKRAADIGLDFASKLAVARKALAAAASRFREYERVHCAKQSPDGDAKAIVNANMAELCEAALAQAGGDAPKLLMDEVRGPPAPPPMCKACNGFGYVEDRKCANCVGKGRAVAPAASETKDR